MIEERKERERLERERKKITQELMKWLNSRNIKFTCQEDFIGEEVGDRITLEKVDVELPPQFKGKEIKLPFHICIRHHEIGKTLFFVGKWEGEESADKIGGKDGD